MSSTANALAGLGLLTGDFSGVAASLAAPKIETRAQRKAKAAFTTAETTPPWKDTKTTASADVRLSAVKAMKTIVDPASSADTAVSQDVSTSFVAYKALDRLRTLAERAAADTTGSAERATLQTLFARGMAQLEGFLASAPSDKVDIAFGKAARQVQTVAIAAPSSLSASTIKGRTLVETSTDPLPGVNGDETLTIDLSRPGGIADRITVDLSSAPRPPTLNGVADAINAAIAAVPRRDADGNPELDADGQPVPLWSVRVAATMNGEKAWGLSIQRSGFETIAIDQVGGGDTVMVAGGIASGATLVDGKLVEPPVDTRVVRIDDPDDTMARRNLSTLTALDRPATERLAVAAEADGTGKTKATTIAAAMRTQAMVSDAQGNSYLVGTTAGDLGGNRSNGTDDLVLTKLDSEGRTVWQRTLGTAGTASGAAIAIDPRGGVAVAATVSGSVDGANADGDMFVARFDAVGEETGSTLIRSVGADTATAIAVDADGAIYVGGRTPADGGDAYVARIGSDGKLAERRSIGGTGSETVRALAIGGDGELVALTGEDGHAVLHTLEAASLANEIASLDLGVADARALAVAADGRIAVAGARSDGGDRDAFVARVDAALHAADITAIGTADDDQADSVSFLGDDLYVGGRTSGTLGEEKTGTVDAFVARVDATTGAVEHVHQFGTVATIAQPVQVAAIRGGNSVLTALGFARGTLTPTDAVSLEAQTSLRAGDSFSLKVNGGAARKITIERGDTLTTLADKVRKATGSTIATVTTPIKDGERSLRLDVKPGQTIQLLAGPAGGDALEKLGLDARRIATPAVVDDDAPKVRPGGTFALNLSDALQLGTRTEAKNALARIEQAISYTQSAYRSLYWDDTKAALVDAPTTKGRAGASTAVKKAQLANYQAALTRLSSSSSTTSLGF